MNAYLPIVKTVATFVTYEDVERLRKANSEKKLLQYIKSFYASEESIINNDFIPGELDEFDERDRVLMLSCIRRAFITAMKIRGLIESDDISLEKMKKHNLDIEEYEDEESGPAFNVMLSLNLDGWEYMQFVKKGCEALDRRDLEYVFERPVIAKCEGNQLKIYGTYANTAYGIKKCCVDILDTLSAIHLSDIFAETMEGIPFWRSNSNLSSLWYLMCDFFREGSIVRCKGCELPIPVSRKPGKQREYCGDACRKAAQRKRLKEALEQETSQTSHHR